MVVLIFFYINKEKVGNLINDLKGKDKTLKMIFNLNLHSSGKYLLFSFFCILTIFSS